MKALKVLLAVVCLSGVGMAVTACDDSEGPAEQAGEKVDEAVQDTKRAIDDATD